MEFIRLMERGEWAADEREPLIPMPACALTVARFPAFAGLLESCASRKRPQVAG
jgi:hypothetical protein